MTRPRRRRAYGRYLRIAVVERVVSFVVCLRTVTITKQVDDVKAVAREHTTLAIEKLVAIVKDDNRPAAVQVAAAIAILDRGWGKPAQAVSIDHNKRVIDI